RGFLSETVLREVRQCLFSHFTCAYFCVLTLLPESDLGLQSLEDLDVLAVLCQRNNCLFGFGCFSNNHTAAFFLSVHVHGTYILYFCSFEHFLNSFFDLSFVCFRMNQESIFLLAHRVHALLCYDWFQNNVVISDISHYAYTSSMDATLLLVAITVLYFSRSNTLMVLTDAV